MFRTQQTNAFDDVVAKATDENLTSENWEFMMDCWEKVNSAGDSGPKEAVAALIKRLAHRNANVQIYTLELANALAQNCGPKMHTEMSSRAFTDALVRLANDRNTHSTVKTKVVEKMAEWTGMFSSNPDLGIMAAAYGRLSTNPSIQPPSKPQKQEISDLERQKEEEELQRALAISLQERSAAQASKPVQQPGQPKQTQPHPQAAPVAAPPQTAATVSRVRALYDFVPSESGELAFRKGDVIAVLESVYKDWWKGSLRGQVGIFPLNYVEKLRDPTPEEVQKDAQMENEVFGQIKNVEKLLALLSTSSTDPNVQDNDEITTLYHSTLAIRPKLIELLGKYSQKKDDFMALNEKFIKARKDYEALLDSSMAHPSAAYGRPPSRTPYGYPPGGDGYVPPPSADPSRYYTPGPQRHNPSASPVASGSAYPPPHGPQRQSSGGYPGYPPQHEGAGTPGPGPGSAPFYMVGQNRPGAQQLPNHAHRTPSAPPTDYAPPPQAQQPPPQTSPVEVHSNDASQPQELATSIYDTPIESRPPEGRLSGEPSHPPTSHQAPSHPPTSAQRPKSPSQPPGGYAAYNYHPYQRPVSSAPTPHSAPYPESVTSPISPVNTPAQPYPQLSSPPPGQAYQAYNPQQQRQSYYPPSDMGPPPQGPPGGVPQDYYRQSEYRAQG